MKFNISWVLQALIWKSRKDLRRLEVWITKQNQHQKNYPNARKNISKQIHSNSAKCTATQKVQKTEGKKQTGLSDQEMSGKSITKVYLYI